MLKTGICNTTAKLGHAIQQQKNKPLSHYVAPAKLGHAI